MRFLRWQTSSLGSFQTRRHVISIDIRKFRENLLPSPPILKMKTWGISETSVSMYAIICITECGKPQTHSCRKFRNPLLKPDCHLLYKHDSLSQAVPSLHTIGSPFNPSSSLYEYPILYVYPKRHLELPVCIVRTECSQTPRATECTGPKKWPCYSRSQPILPNNTARRSDTAM